MKQFQSVSFRDVEMTGGFWKARQQINGDVSVRYIYKNFVETGRFEALHFDYHEGMPLHIFYDSDIAKWIESASYILEKRDDPELERIIDDSVDLICAHQEENGYFNMWFTMVEPTHRFQKRTEHELYCAGHLFEAAAAYHFARGKDKLLHAMCRYADLIDRVFRVEKSAAYATPGHEEIELGLFRLYQATGNETYKDLAVYFLDARGYDHRDVTYDWGNNRYAQDHAPVREQSTAEGHAVRAGYLYAAMAEAAWETGDQALYAACRRIFDNILYRRMYITGGVGSAKNGEAFTVDYDLPNETAYSESCAAIALAFFARRLSRIEPDSRYADVAETCMYNGILSTVSLNGKEFFYENPLEVNMANHGRDAAMKPGKDPLPPAHRQEVFDCSCCPPNITRFIASVGDHFYTYADDVIYIHQYAASSACIGTAHVLQETDYPVSGDVKITLTGWCGRAVRFRVPGWCRSYRVTVGGQEIVCPVENGYALITPDADEFTFAVSFDMPVVLIEARGDVLDDAGKVAVRRGPVVYCMERGEGEGPLSGVMLDPAASFTVGDAARYGVPTLAVEGYRQVPSRGEWLYREFAPEYARAALTLIPYFGFANETERDMRVWFRVKL